MVVVRELLQHVLPALLLLEFVHPGGDQGHETAPPHAGPARYDRGREGRARVVDELAGWVEAFAPVTQQAGGVCFGVEVQEESPEHDSKAAVKHVKAVL